MGIIAALPVAPGNSGLCAVQFASLAIPPLVMAISGMLAQPYTATAYQWFQLGSSLAVALAAVASAGLVVRQSNGEAPGVWLELYQAAALMQTGILFFRVVAIIVIKVLDLLWWDTDARRVVWVEGMEPHRHERINGVCLAALLAATDEAIEMTLSSDRLATQVGPTKSKSKHRLISKVAAALEQVI